MSFGAALACLACGSGASELDPSAVLEAYDRAAARADWPGFRADRVPLAVTDGSRTWLWRHPAPPPAYRAAGPSVHVMEGEDAAVGASTAPSEGARGHPEAGVRVGGHRTAAVRVDRPVRPEDVARRLLHAAIHAHQDSAGPPAPDEALRLARPAPGADGLHAGRLETTALRRALTARDTLRQACWIGEALGRREDRSRALPEDLLAYERAVEAREGPARWLLARAVGGDEEPRLPAEGYPLRAIRRRAAGVGHAWTLLLAERVPAWRDSVAAAGALRPGRLLGTFAATGRRRCRLAYDEVRRARAVVDAEVARAAEDAARQARAVAATPGWSLVLEGTRADPARVAPGRPSGAVALVDGRVLFGTGGLTLRHASGRLALDGVRALAEPVGGAPSFPSVGRLLVVGLRPGPSVEAQGDTVRLSGPGVEGRFVGASVARDEEARRVRVVLGGAGG